MKIPEPLFAVINPAMRLLLASPLHGLLSDSLLLITYHGAKTSRRYTTPLRYLRDGDAIRCFTSKDTKWWRNLQGGREVRLTIKGRQDAYLAQVMIDQPDVLRAHLAQYLEQFPQDADYHGVGLDEDGKPVSQDLDRVCAESIVVEMRRSSGTGVV